MGATLEGSSRSSKATFKKTNKHNFGIIALFIPRAGFHGILPTLALTPCNVPVSVGFMFVFMDFWIS